MNREPNQAIVVECLRRIAPEIDAESLDTSAELRDELDLDSMDFLNFVESLHETTGIDVPESDYRRLSTVDSCVGYLQRRWNELTPS